MSLGSPELGTSSNPWFSQTETDMTTLLTTLSDNTSQSIQAKDVRDAIWTLYNGGGPLSMNVFPVWPLTGPTIDHTLNGVKLVSTMLAQPATAVASVSVGATFSVTFMIFFNRQTLYNSDILLEISGNAMGITETIPGLPAWNPTYSVPSNTSIMSFGYKLSGTASTGTYSFLFSAAHRSFTASYSLDFYHQ